MLFRLRWQDQFKAISFSMKQWNVLRTAFLIKLQFILSLLITVGTPWFQSPSLMNGNISREIYKNKQSVFHSFIGF